MEHKHSGSSNMFLDIVEGYIEIFFYQKYILHEQD
jgi:hypothetical protein